MGPNLLEPLWIRLEGLHLDEGVLLGPHPLPGLPVVVHAGLAILRRVNRVPLAKLDLARLLEGQEVPADEGIIVGVGVGGDESAPPVSLWRVEEEIVLPSTTVVLNDSREVGNRQSSTLCNVLSFIHGNIYIHTTK